MEGVIATSMDVSLITKRRKGARWSGSAQWDGMGRKALCVDLPLFQKDQSPCCWENPPFRTKLI